MLHAGRGRAWGLCDQRHIQLLEVGTPMLAPMGLYWPQLLWPSMGRAQRGCGPGREHGMGDRNGERAERQGHPVAGSLPLSHLRLIMLETRAPEGPLSCSEGLTSLWSRK